MALDFPVGTDFPDNGDQIPDGYEYEGFYWDATDEVWRRKCDSVDLDDVYLKRRGDEVNDADDTVSYSWNEDLQLYSGKSVRIEGSQEVKIQSANANVDIDADTDVNVEASGQTRVLGFSGVTVSSNSGDVTLESPSNAERVNRTIDHGTDIDEQITNKRYVDERDQLLANQIVELEEEIEAIAPSVERGFWTMNLLGTVANQGQMSLYDDNYTNVGSPTGLFKDAKSIWLNEKDNAGTPHGFANVEAGELIELFVQGADEFGLYEVVDVHDETNGAAQWWVIEVTFVRTLEPTSTADNGDIIRVKIFNAPEGGSADEFVKKEGDNMTGRLRMDTEQEIYEQDYRPPSDGSTAHLLLRNISNDTNVTRYGYIWQPPTKDEVAVRKSLHVDSSIYCTSFYGYELNDAADGSGRRERTTLDPRMQFYSFNNDKRGRLKWGGSDDRINWTEAGGSLCSDNTKAKLTWDSDRVEIKKPIANNVNATGFRIRGSRPLFPGDDDVFDQNGEIFRVKHVSGNADHIEYLGSTTEMYSIVTKTYVDTKITNAINNINQNALVDVRSDNPSNPSIGHLWFNKSTNQFLLRIS